MKRLRSVMTGLGVCFALVLTAVPATPAAATTLAAADSGVADSASTTEIAAGSPSCQDWFDPFTYGVACHNFSLDYRARALCANGRTALGPWKRSGWSYAYCSTYGSYLKSFWVETRGAAASALSAPAAADVSTRVANSVAPTVMNSAAAAAIPCQSWWDLNTFGFACANNPVYNDYRAAAECQNDRKVTGPWKRNWAWSYAYCTSVGSSIRYNIREFR